MNSKTLVLQVDIGRGSLLGKDRDWNAPEHFVNETRELIDNVFMPSVKKWASNQGYDYKVITESTYQFEEDPVMNAMYERYVNFDCDYDTIVYIDTDVYVNKELPLPEIKGIMTSPEDHFPITIKRRQDFIDAHPCAAQDTPYVNSGVIMADRVSGKILADYFKFRLENNHKQYFTGVCKNDQSMLSEFYMKYPHLFNRLPIEWNFVLPPHADIEYNKDDVIFAHFIAEGKGQRWQAF